MDTVNMDKNTGIRYGVMPVRLVDGAWFDDASLVGPEDEHEEHYGEVFSRNGYEAHHDRESADVWIEKSKYYTYAPLCSPCAPNAGYLGDAKLGAYNKRNGYATYCFGHEWFDGGKAPYTVYDVETDRRVWA